MADVVLRLRTMAHSGIDAKPQTQGPDNISQLQVCRASGTGNAANRWSRSGHLLAAFPDLKKIIFSAILT